MVTVTMPPPSAALVARFKADLQGLTGGEPEALGVAVSGGPDSLALLLLSAAAYPGKVHAATVDHGLRPESASEAGFVAQLCGDLGVQHTILRLEWPEPRGANIQARSREARYGKLGGWALDRNIPYVATAHHVNDQAETVLMRLARGSGISGLAGTRRRRFLAANTVSGAEVHLVRPLLGWRRDELRGIVDAAGLIAVEDPSNADERYDRVRMRAFLAHQDWLDSKSLADSAHHLAEAEEALDWLTRQLAGDRMTWRDDGRVSIDAHGLPREVQRRLLLIGLSHFTSSNDLPGPKLARLLDQLRAGRAGTLAGVAGKPGAIWLLDWAPPRKS